MLSKSVNGGFRAIGRAPHRVDLTPPVNAVDYRMRRFLKALLIAVVILILGFVALIVLVIYSSPGILIASGQPLPAAPALVSDDFAGFRALSSAASEDETKWEKRERICRRIVELETQLLSMSDRASTQAVLAKLHELKTMYCSTDLHRPKPTTSTGIPYDRARLPRLS